MKKDTFAFSFIEYNNDEIPTSWHNLIEQAKLSLSGSNSDYSHFKVGAAVSLENGVVVCGANQENVSFPCSTCAERSALNFARSNYPKVKVSAIAVVASRGDEIEDSISPCGLCRQSIVDVEMKQKSYIKILLVGRLTTKIIESAGFLLPLAFSAKI